MSDGATPYRESVVRPLTQQERDLIRWLLEHCHGDTTRFLSQIDRLSVCGKCTCGCPTVDFALDGVPVPGKGHREISDWLAAVEGQLFSISLFETNGALYMLEVTCLPGSDKPFGLPPIESILGH